MSLNLNQYDDDTVQQAFEFMSTNAENEVVASRYRGALGQTYDGDRDLYSVLGYTETPDSQDYLAKYQRTDIAERIVEKPPKDTWRYNPDVREVVEGERDPEEDTEFEQQYQKLVEDTRLYHYCRRADIVAGIGEYSLLFLGVADNETDLSQPIDEGALSGPEDIAYMTPFAQYQVDDWTLGMDADLEPTHERYTRPVIYSIDFADPSAGNPDVRDVHWTRVIHIAEGTVESDLKGTPRLRSIYNRLEDYEKVLGASGEMFWTGADRKYHFDVRDGYADLDSDDLEALDEDVQRLVHDMRHYIKTAGVDMDVIGGEDPDPTGIIDNLIQAIAGAKGIPKRILTGSERGELASSQDKATWFGKIEDRQRNYAEPRILRPIIKRAIRIGALPEAPNGFIVDWPNLFELNELEQAEVHKTRAEALRNVSPSNDPEMLMTREQIVEYMDSGNFPDPDDLEDRVGEAPSDEVSMDQFEKSMRR